MADHTVFAELTFDAQPVWDSPKPTDSSDAAEELDAYLERTLTGSSARMASMEEAGEDLDTGTWTLVIKRRVADGWEIVDSATRTIE